LKHAANEIVKKLEWLEWREHPNPFCFPISLPVVCETDDPIKESVNVCFFAFSELPSRTMAIHHYDIACQVFQYLLERDGHDN
ncbi:MAG: hypothetical protein G01um101433_446, partial [Parcubacteria group bacterium Gr01-1014_33]